MSVLEGELEMADGSVVARSWTRGKRIGKGMCGEVYFMHDEASGDFAAKLVAPVDREDHRRGLRTRCSLSASVMPMVMTIMMVLVLAGGGGGGGGDEW